MAKNFLHRRDAEDAEIRRGISGSKFFSAVLCVLRASVVNEVDCREPAK
jgi:hypothetical protein